MMKKHLIASTALILLFGAAGATAAQTDQAALIDEALSAAPPQVAESARVMDLEGNLLREKATC